MHSLMSKVQDPPVSPGVQMHSFIVVFKVESVGQMVVQKSFV